jgi:CheY-like chemotaxis protein
MMSKTLIVSDNEILNQLYVVNLETYLATKVVVVLSTQKALELISSGEKYDLILTMSMMNGNDSAIAIHDFITTNNLLIPLIVIGNPTKEIDNITIVQSSYHLQNLLRACALQLGVTAKDMAAILVPEYFAIETNFILRLKEAPCSIYLQVLKSNEEPSFILVAKKGSSITEVIKKFVNEGVESLFVNRLDRLFLVNSVSAILCDFIKSTEHLGAVEKSEALEEGFEFVAQEFSQNPAAVAEIMDISNACTKIMQDIVKDVPGLNSLINILIVNKRGYIYTHSILSSFIASHVIKKISWGGVGHIEKINFVLFFHDIMLTPIYLKYPTLKYEEDLLFCDELTEKDKEVVLNHARLSAEMIMCYKKSPMGVDLLIKQHHGMTSGVGFAVEFKDDISPLTKVILVAESFVEEYMKGKDENPELPIDVNRIISILSEKYRKSTYKKIVETLHSLSL